MHFTALELGMEEGGRVVAGDDAAGAEPPFDLVVWHVGAAGAGDLPAADLLAPHGLLVVVQPSADGAAAAAVHDALAEGPLEYVTLPSPDGDGCSLRRRDDVAPIVASNSTVYSASAYKYVAVLLMAETEETPALKITLGSLAPEK